jgi:hypothetical protein
MAVSDVIGLFRADRTVVTVRASAASTGAAQAGNRRVFQVRQRTGQ